LHFSTVSVAGKPVNWRANSNALVTAPYGFPRGWDAIHSRNVFMREPGTSIRAARTLRELFEDRFILGLGVSAKTANEVRGLRWKKPVTFMRDYVAKMKATPYMAPGPKSEPPVVLAGILPKMVELAATETKGTHTYFVSPEHTARVRSQIGPDKWICAEQAVMLESDASRAREAARKYMSFYLRLPGSLHKKAPHTWVWRCGFRRRVQQSAGRRRGGVGSCRRIACAG
jgi:probable F420-dependent oxidoreductase